MTARAFCKEGATGMKLHSWLIIGPMRPVASNSHVPGGNALHRAIFVEQDLGRSKSRKDLDAEPFCLPREPAAEIAEAQRIHALIAHERRHQKFRYGKLALLGEHPMMIFRDWNGKRRSPLLPIRKEFVQRNRIDQRARKGVGTTLAVF